jgi:hypothetical protein
MLLIITFINIVLFVAIIVIFINTKSQNRKQRIEKRICITCFSLALLGQAIIFTITV